MPNPKRPALNRARERRIEQEIVVDAWNEEERALGWYYHLESRLQFPFRAKCMVARKISPLRKDEEVEVLGMAPEDDCMHEMFVIIRFAGRNLGVPLVQLDPVKPDPSTRQAVEDWRYWKAMRYQF
jgi:hypothetical protein